MKLPEANWGVWSELEEKYIQTLIRGEESIMGERACFNGVRHHS